MERERKMHISMREEGDDRTSVLRLLTNVVF